MNRLLNNYKKRGDQLSIFFENSELYESMDKLDAAYRINKPIPELMDKEKYECYITNIFKSEVYTSDIIDILDTVFYDCPQMCCDLKKAYLLKKEEKIQNCKREFEGIGGYLFVKEKARFKNINELIQYCTNDELIRMIATAVYIIKRKTYSVEMNCRNGTEEEQMYALGMIRGLHGEVLEEESEEDEQFKENSIREIIEFLTENHGSAKTVIYGMKL